MKAKFKTILPYIISYVISSSLGVLFHFLYSWLNESVIVAPFVPVNESIFEHLKLLFYPFLIVSIIELLIRRKSIKKCLPYRILFITLAVIILPTIYYTLKSCIGNVGFVNISLYFICLFLAYFLSYIAEKKQLVPTIAMQLTALFITILLIFTFTLMTFTPPEIELFRDPITNTYGI